MSGGSASAVVRPAPPFGYEREGTRTYRPVNMTSLAQVFASPPPSSRVNGELLPPVIVIDTASPVEPIGGAITISAGEHWHLRGPAILNLSIEVEAGAFLILEDFKIALPAAGITVAAKGTLKLVDCTVENSEEGAPAITCSSGNLIVADSTIKAAPSKDADAPTRAILANSGESIIFIGTCEVVPTFTDDGFVAVRFNASEASGDFINLVGNFGSLHLHGGIEIAPVAASDVTFSSFGKLVITQEASGATTKWAPIMLLGDDVNADTMVMTLASVTLDTPQAALDDTLIQRTVVATLNDDRTALTTNTFSAYIGRVLWDRQQFNGEAVGGTVPFQAAVSNSAVAAVRLAA